MKTKYFPFIGECKCVQLDHEPTKIGATLHKVRGDDWSISIYSCDPDSDLVYIRSANFLWSEDRPPEIMWYLADRGSFDCQPAVPVEYYGKTLEKHLAHKIQ